MAAYPTISTAPGANGTRQAVLSSALNPGLAQPEVRAYVSRKRPAPHVASASTYNVMSVDFKVGHPFSQPAHVTQQFCLCKLCHVLHAVVRFGAGAGVCRAWPIS